MDKSSKVFVGLDVHKDSIDVVMAESDSAVRHHGQIGGTRAAWQKLVRQLVCVGCRIGSVTFTQVPGRTKASPISSTAHPSSVQRMCRAIAESSADRT
jgi:hypothetical protein